VQKKKKLKNGESVVAEYARNTWLLKRIEVIYTHIKLRPQPLWNWTV